MELDSLRNEIVYNLNRRAKKLREERKKWDTWLEYGYKHESESIKVVFENLGEICEPSDDERSVDIRYLINDISPSEFDQEVRKEQLISKCKEFIDEAYEKGKYDGRDAKGFFLTLLEMVDPKWEAELRSRV